MIFEFGHCMRVLRVIWILARHGALLPLNAFGVPNWLLRILNVLVRRSGPSRPGERLAQALQLLGPTFVKFGQSISVRGDLIGEEVAEDLSILQDSLPPYPSAAAIATLENELGRSRADLFADFDKTPTAAASIAQVHFATLHDGTAVAVKVLRPGIAEAFARDIKFFYWIASGLERVFPKMRRLKPVEIIRNFEETTNLELDLRLEAAAAAELAENFKDDPDFYVPRVDWDRTSERVLTIEKIDGIPIDEVMQLQQVGIVPRDVLERSVRIFFNQVFRDGLFHADMHPGNVFVRSGGVLTPVDFGIMGRLDRRTRHFLAAMLIALFERDYVRLAEVHFAAGYVSREKSQGAFSQACRAIAEPILGKPQREISIARLLGQLFQVTRMFEMETQPQLLLLQKTMLVAEGVGRKLDPETSMWALAEPLVAEWAIIHRRPDARVCDLLSEAMDRVERIPYYLLKLENMAGMITKDGIKLHPETLELYRKPKGNGLWKGCSILLLILLTITLMVLVI